MAITQLFKREQRIKIWMGWALIITAICVDLAELGITWVGLVAFGGILSDILAFVAAALFGVWFGILGVQMSSNTQKFGVGIVTFIMEIIPGFDAIPILSWMWTFGMIITVGMVRMEDNGEKPTILGAFSNVMSITSLNPAEMVLRSIKKRVLRKPQKPLENVGADDTINESGKVIEMKRPLINNDIQSKFKKAA